MGLHADTPVALFNRLSSNGFSVFKPCVNLWGMLRFAALMEMSKLLNTGLDADTLALCVRLCENGVNPEALALVIQELRRESAAIKVRVTFVWQTQGGTAGCSNCNAKHNGGGGGGGFNGFLIFKKVFTHLDYKPFAQKVL